MGSRLSLGRQRSLSALYLLAEGIAQIKKIKVAEAINKEIMTALEHPVAGLVAFGEQVIRRSFSQRTGEQLINYDGMPMLYFRRGKTRDTSIVFGCMHPAAQFIETGRGNEGMWIVPRRSKFLEVSRLDLGEYGKTEQQGFKNTVVDLLNNRKSLWDSMLDKREELIKLRGQARGLELNLRNRKASKISKRKKKTIHAQTAEKVGYTADIMIYRNQIADLRSEIASKSLAYKDYAAKTRREIKALSKEIKKKWKSLHYQLKPATSEDQYAYLKRVRAPRRVPFLEMTMDAWSSFEKNLTVDLGEYGKRILIKTEGVKLTKGKPHGF